MWESMLAMAPTLIYDGLALGGDDHCLSFSMHGGLTVPVLAGRARAELRSQTVTARRAGGHVDVLAVTIAPVVLGGGKRLFEGFDRSVDLQQVDARQSKWATHLRYLVEK